jgi:hypothetical protein
LAKRTNLNLIQNFSEILVEKSCLNFLDTYSTSGNQTLKIPAIHYDTLKENQYSNCRCRTTLKISFQSKQKTAQKATKLITLLFDNFPFRRLYFLLQTNRIQKRNQYRRRPYNGKNGGNPSSFIFFFCVVWQHNGKDVHTHTHTLSGGQSGTGLKKLSFLPRTLRLRSSENP